MTETVRTFEGAADVETDDGGHAKIVEIGDDHEFVRIQSWSGEKSHPFIDQIAGKKIRVTVEVID